MPPTIKQAVSSYLIEELQEENAALLAALRHLLLVAKKADIEDKAITMAENALRRNKVL